MMQIQMVRPKMQTQNSIMKCSIELKNINKSNEWLIGRFGEGNNAENDLVHEYDDLIWGVLTEVIGAENPIANTKSTSVRNESTSNLRSKCSSTSNGVVVSSSRRESKPGEGEEFGC